MRKVQLDLLIKAIWDGTDLDNKGSQSLKRIGNLAAVELGVATAAAVKFGKESTEAFTSFEKGMNEVFTLLPGISDTAMDEMKKQVLDLSTTMGILPDKVVPALYQAISAGVPQENVFDFLTVAGEAARGGVTTLEVAVDGITSVVNAYGEEVINAAEASDLMFTAVKLGKTDFEQLSKRLFQVTPIAAALGVDFGNLTAALATMTAQGTPTRVAATQLRQVLVELSDTSSEASQTFQELSGKSFVDFIAGGGNLSDALQLMRGRSDELNVGINELFGSIEAGNAAMSLTSDVGAEKFTNALDEMDSATGAATEANDKMNESFAVTIEKADAAEQRLKILAGEGLIPGQKAATEYYTSLLLLAGSLIELNAAAEAAIDTNNELIENEETADEATKKLLDTWLSLDDFWGKMVGRRELNDDLHQLIISNADLSGSTQEVEAQLKELDERFRVAAHGEIFLADTTVGFVDKLQYLSITQDQVTAGQEEAAEQSAVLAGEVENADEAVSDYVDTAEGAVEVGESVAKVARSTADAYKLQGKNAEEAAAAAEELTKRTADYFSAVLDGDDNLNIFNEDIDRLGQGFATIGGRTAEQSEALKDLQNEYDRTTEKINSLTFGVDSLNGSDEERNEQILEQQEYLGQLTAAMEPLASIQGEMVETNTEATINQQALNEELFRSVGEAGASAESLAILGGALGLYSDEAVEAALKSALVNTEIDRLSQLYADGQISVENMLGSVEDYVENLDNEFAAAITGAKQNNIKLKDSFYDSADATSRMIDRTIVLKQQLEEVPDKIKVQVTQEGFDLLRQKARQAAEAISSMFSSSGVGGSSSSGSSSPGSPDPSDSPAPPDNASSPSPVGATPVTAQGITSTTNVGGITIITQPGQDSAAIASDVVDEIGARSR